MKFRSLIVGVVIALASSVAAEPTIISESSLAHVKDPLMRQTLMHANRFVVALFKIESLSDLNEIKNRLKNIQEIALNISPFYLTQEIQKYPREDQFFHPASAKKMAKPLFATSIRLLRWAQTHPKDSAARIEIENTIAMLRSINFDGCTGPIKNLNK